MLLSSGGSSASPSDDSPGWNQILSEPHWKVPSRYSIRAYSEFLPSPSAAARPYETVLDKTSSLLSAYDFSKVFQESVPDGFGVDPFEDLVWVRPGLQAVGKAYVTALSKWIATEEGSPFPKEWAENNPYWPRPFFKAKSPPRLWLFLPLALTKTRDENGKDPWTLLGGSSRPLAQDFYSSFSSCEALSQWLFQKERSCAQLKEEGVGVYSRDDLPEALKPLAMVEITPIVVTLEAAAYWPKLMRERFVEGAVEVAPHPSSLIPNGIEAYHRLAEVRADARELPLALVLSRYRKEAQSRLVIPETGSFAQSALRKMAARHKALKRLANDSRGVFKKLFDFSPDAVELYAKPSARNAQAWGTSGPLKNQWVLHGPDADREIIEAVKERILKDKGASKIFYREYFPPQNLLGFEIKWHRPLTLLAHLQGGTVTDWQWGWDRRGVVTAQKEGLNVALQPFHRDADGFSADLAGLAEKKKWPLAESAKKLNEFSSLLGSSLSHETAAVLLPSKNGVGQKLSTFFEGLEKSAAKAATALKGKVTSDSVPRVSPLTFSETVLPGHAYENRYWKWIAELSQTFSAKNNTECIGSEKAAGHCQKNELPDVSTYLERYYHALGINTHRMPFHWTMDFEVPWWGGWALNSPLRPLKDIAEDGHHNLIAVIPAGTKEAAGEAVILADHYDTAFMGDVYDGSHQADLAGHRHASAGADDNHSATATLMAAAQALIKVRDKLKRDVWLVHLTGEEYPADCLGARALSEALVKGTPLISGKPNPKIVGLYVLDMVAHNTDREDAKTGEPGPSIFQISPGRGERSAALAQLMHRVTLTWNGLAGKDESQGWNAAFDRKPGWERVPGPKPPKASLFPEFRGEIRLPWDQLSTLYNTDGIIFSDAGIPVVLMMENYDINRTGYHDTLDTLVNIDLDFGAGLSRIAIESVAQAASR